MMDSSTKESSMDMELLHSKTKTNYKQIGPTINQKAKAISTSKVPLK